jgi:hypothetical protein
MNVWYARHGVPDKTAPIGSGQKLAHSQSAPVLRSTRSGGDKMSTDALWTVVSMHDCGIHS